MAGSLTLARRRRHVTNFTTVKNAWTCLQDLEGTEDIEKHLLLVDRRPEARQEIIELTYERLCLQLRETGHADIRDPRDAKGDEPIPYKYGLWACVLNEYDKKKVLEGSE
jgi:hypothetical protein